MFKSKLNYSTIQGKVIYILILVAVVQFVYPITLRGRHLCPVALYLCLQSCQPRCIVCSHGRAMAAVHLYQLCHTLYLGVR